MKINENVLQFDEVFFNEFNGYSVYFIIDTKEAPKWLKEMFLNEKKIEHFELCIELVSGDEQPFVQVSPSKIINGIHTDYDWKDVYMTEEELLLILEVAQEQINNRRVQKWEN